MKRCHNCGAKNKDRFTDCVRCAEPLDTVEERQPSGSSFSLSSLSSVFSFLVLVGLLLAFVWAWNIVNPPESEAPPHQVARPRTTVPSGVPGALQPAVDLQQASSLARAGMIAFHEEQYEKAAMLFEQFVGDAPSNPYGQMYLGLSYYQMGDQDLAIEAMERAFECAPDDTEIGNYLITMLENAEDYTRAEEVVRACIDSEPEDQEARLTLVRIIRRRGDLEEAVAEGERLMTEAPESFDAALELGECLKASGELARAGDVYRQATELDPESAPAHYALGATEHLAGDYEKAIGTLKKAIGLDPENGRYHLSLAQAYEAADSIEESLEEYEVFLELSPDDPRAAKIAQLVERARKALEERSKQKNT